MKKIFFTIIIINFGFISFSQLRIIEGKVRNIGGETLSGVKVSAKEAPAIFTLTDGKGKYKLEIPEEVTGLIFSYSGMTKKTVIINDLKTINVKLIPSGYKKFRFGGGFALGKSVFEIYNILNNPDSPDTTKVSLYPFAIDASIFYRINKKFEIQGSLEDGLNLAKFEVDSITPTGDTITNYETSGVNRITFSILANYNFNISKTGNYSAFIGIGPQFQHLSFLKTNTLGARFQMGANLNNYGFTTRLYFALDISAGEFSENNNYVPNFPYQYISSRLGVIFIF